MMMTTDFFWGRNCLAEKVFFGRWSSREMRHGKKVMDAGEQVSIIACERELAK
jgi:hypothetical protein